jgi:thioester reductase-like protein
MAQPLSGHYDGKTVLLTGCTGFLGKVCLERILWEFPDVKEIRCLVRHGSGNQNSAESRLNKLWSLPLFQRLKARHQSSKPGDSFERWVTAKVCCCAGDIESDGFNMDSHKKEDMVIGVDIVIHCAALVSWDERIDRSVNANCIGTRRLLELVAAHSEVHGTKKRPVRFLYVSSTFTNGMRCNRRGPFGNRCQEVAFDPNTSIMAGS